MNKSNSILLIDPSFDPSSSTRCELLVKVGIDSLSYAIIDKEMHKIVAVYDEQECGDGAKKLRERLKTDHYLQLQYQQAKASVHTPNTIAIPDAFFGTVDLTTHTQYFAAPHSNKLYTKSQPNFRLTTIFSFPKKTEECLTALNSKNYQEFAGLLQLAEHSTTNVLWMDFSATSVVMVYVKEDQLIFQQTFEISNADELNYYLLLLISQFEIDPLQTQVKLTGIIHEGDEQYNCLQKYFAENEFVAVNTHLNQEILEDLPAHYFTNLIALDQCG